MLGRSAASKSISVRPVGGPEKIQILGTRLLKHDFLVHGSPRGQIVPKVPVTKFRVLAPAPYRNLPKQSSKKFASEPPKLLRSPSGSSSMRKLVAELIWRHGQAGRRSGMQRKTAQRESFRDGYRVDIRGLDGRNRARVNS